RDGRGRRPNRSRTAGERPRQRLERRHGLVFQSREHVEILALDDGPAVMPPEELAAVAAQHRTEWPRGLEQIHRLGKLLERFVIEAGVAANRLSLQHVAL